MISFAPIIGIDSTQAEIESKRFLKFEMKLANISMRENEHELCTLRDLEQRYPYIQWVQYINALLPSSLAVDEEEVVSLLRPSYFTDLGELLNQTPSHVIKNYSTWRAYWAQTQLTPVIEKVKKCAKTTAKKLPMAVSAMYVRKYFDQITREAILKMVEAIRSEFQLVLKESISLDERTRKKALEKLNTIIVHIGYPDELLNDSGIENFYENLKIGSSFLSSLLSINKFNIDHMLAKLREPIRKSYWDMDMPTFSVNAEYSPTENELQFPAAILQGNFFSSDRPWYMNFGAIGSVIGHELTHGFADMDKLVADIVCTFNQYRDFTEPMTGLKVDGMKTLEENIADNEGFKVSYLAYQNWKKDTGVESKLPGLDYSPQQMFWISAAQMYCSIANQGKMLEKVKIDDHSPDRFRIIGSFRNRKEFANDFKCPIGSPMNPAKKCEVW